MKKKRISLRKLNAILGPVMIVLLLFHGITGAFQLTSLMPGGSVIRSILTLVLVVCVVIHAVLGTILTVESLVIWHRAGVSYFKNNEAFWIRRITGFAMIILIVYHVLVFSGTSGEAFRLNSFGGLQLAAHILLALILAVHLIMNIQPLMIALGIENRKFIKDVMIVLSILMLLFALGFVAYYLRWNVLWRYGR